MQSNYNKLSYNESICLIISADNMLDYLYTNKILKIRSKTDNVLEEFINNMIKTTVLGKLYDINVDEKMGEVELIKLYECLLKSNYIKNIIGKRDFTKVITALEPQTLISIECMDTTSLNRLMDIIMGENDYLKFINF